MGLGRSQVPRISLVGGIIGFITGMTMIYWTGAVDYELIVGGKPYFSPMFAFPISYELTILLQRSLRSAACSFLMDCRCIITPY